MNQNERTRTLCRTDPWQQLPPNEFRDLFLDYPEASSEEPPAVEAFIRSIRAARG